MPGSGSTRLIEAAGRRSRAVAVGSGAKSLGCAGRSTVSASPRIVAAPARTSVVHRRLVERPLRRPGHRLVARDAAGRRRRSRRPRPADGRDRRRDRSTAATGAAGRRTASPIPARLGAPATSRSDSQQARPRSRPRPRRRPPWCRPPARSPSAIRTSCSTTAGSMTRSMRSRAVGIRRHRAEAPRPRRPATRPVRSAPRRSGRTSVPADRRRGAAGDLGPPRQPHRLLGRLRTMWMTAVLSDGDRASRRCATSTCAG